MAKTDPDQTADQVADLQAQLDQSRSECIRPIIMEHIHRAMRSKSNTDKYHEYHSLCVGCLGYLEDEDLKAEIMRDLEKPETNLSNDFIRCYRAEMKSGVPNYLILENEYARIVPRIVKVWLKVQKALVEQELVPWSLTYPEQLVEGSLMDELLTDIQMQKFRGAAPVHGAETLAFEAPRVDSQLLQVHNHYNDEDEDELQARGNVPAEEAVSEDSVHTGERLTEPVVDRFSPLDPEPPIPANVEKVDGDEVYSDEEIDRGAEAIKKLLRENLQRHDASREEAPAGDDYDCEQEKGRANHVRRLRKL